MKRKSNAMIGVALALVAAFLVASLSTVVKIASTSLSTTMMVWCRQFIALMLFLPVMTMDARKRGRHAWRAGRPYLQMFRVITSLGAAYCLFYALAHLPLVNAIMLSNTRPLFIPILAWILVGKRVEKVIWITLAIGFVGVLFVLKPGSDLFQTASLVGLASGLLGGMAFLNIRWLAKSVPPNQITFFYFWTSTIISSIPLFWHWEPPCSTCYWWLLLIGVLSVAYQMCMTRAYRYARATIVGGVLFSSLIFGAIYEWLIWDKVPGVLSCIGIVLVLGSSLVAIACTQRRPVDHKPPEA